MYCCLGQNKSDRVAEHVLRSPSRSIGGNRSAWRRLEGIDLLGGCSNDVIRCTECAADENAIGTTENDPV